MDISPNAGGAGSFSFDPSSSPALPSTGRGRVRSADFGLPERSGLLDLARTYLDTQARLWPELVGTAAVPAADAATIAAMADDFERRFRQQHAEVFRPGGTSPVWLALAVAYLRFSDENSNPRSLDQQLLNVLNRARREGVFVPWCYVLADAVARRVARDRHPQPLTGSHATVRMAREKRGFESGLRPREKSGLERG
jgi:hypothetical protein